MADWGIPAIHSAIRNKSAIRNLQSAMYGSGAPASPRRPRRLADDEARRDDDALRLGVVVLVEAVQHELRGVPSLIGTRPPHRRQRHTQQIAEGDIADADHGDIVGDTQAGLP